MIVLAVTWQAKPAKEKEAADILAKLTVEARREPGCVMFQVHRHREKPGLFFIYEQYKDDTALEAHRKTPHFLEFARKQLPAVADRLQGDLYDPLA